MRSGLPGQRLGVLALAGIARHHRHARRRRDRLGLGLAAHAPHGLRRRPDEDEPGLAHGLGEVGILRQEPIARMDRLRPRGLGRGDDPVAAQVALPRRPRPDLHHLVGDAG